MFDPIEIRDDPTLAKKLEYLADGDTVFTYRAYILKGPEHDDGMVSIMKVRLYEWGKTLSQLLSSEISECGFTVREPRIEDPEPLDRVITYRIGLKRKCCCKGNS